MIYYSTLKKKEGNSGIYYNIVNLEDILLSKTSVTKDIYCVIPRYKFPTVVKLLETESRMMVVSRK